MVKRILSSIRIREISAVDRPAQEGARAVLMKRGAPDKPGEASPASLTLEKRFALMQEVNAAVDAVARSIQADDESIAQATDRLFRTQPEFYRVVDNRLRDLAC